MRLADALCMPFRLAAVINEPSQWLDAHARGIPSACSWKPMQVGA